MWLVPAGRKPISARVHSSRNRSLRSQRSVDDRTESRVRRFAAGDLPETTDHPGGDLIPVDVQRPLRRVEEERTQQIAAWDEVRGKRRRQSIRCEAVQTPADDHSGHVEFINQGADTAGNTFVVANRWHIRACELMKVRRRGVIHAQRASERVEDLRRRVRVAALFDSEVVVRAHARQGGQFLAA